MAIMSNLGNRRWWALGALTLAVLAVGLDGTVLSVALPTLAAALHASESDLQWFSSGYLLVLAAAMLPAGLLGDRYGRKKVMLVALALFGIGSAACAYAPSAGAFIAARVLLGLAGSGVIVMALSALTVLFTKEERPRAVGIWAAANFLALPLGPILGGWLLTNYWWGWVFLLNVPVALVGLAAAFALVPESRSPLRPKLDTVGIVASTAGLVVGAVPADRVARLVGAKLTVALGFILLAAGLLLGATTGVGSSGTFIAAWMALVGAGMGFAMATATSAALSELSQERSGVGSAVMQALQKVGAPFGTAILGSVLSSAYQAQLNLAGLPSTVANVVKGSLFGGLAVAQQLGSASLLASVRTAFVHGMDVSLVVAAGIAAAGFVLTLAFLPGRT